MHPISKRIARFIGAHLDAPLLASVLLLMVTGMVAMCGWAVTDYQRFKEKG